MLPWEAAAGAPLSLRRGGRASRAFEHRRPQRDDASILGASRAAEARTGYKHCLPPKWLAALPMVRLRLRKDVIATGENSGYQARCARSCPRAASAMHTPCKRHAHAMQAPCIRYATQATPHLMLYVLHEPIAAEGDLPVVRRLLLTSANLSAAPWGYARGEQLRMGQSARARHPPPRPAGRSGSPETSAEDQRPARGCPLGPPSAGPAHPVGGKEGLRRGSMPNLAAESTWGTF